jgi:predicted O-methyltransferase YrrM
MISTIQSTLQSETVRNLLTSLFIEADAQEIELAERARSFEGQLVFDKALCDSFDDMYLAIDHRMGNFLYNLVRATNPTHVVEFGTSFGVSTIHMAAALRDNGNVGSIVSAEIQPNKVTRATQNIRAAHLDDLIEIRLGDAMETLATIDYPIDILLLDGWPNLYLPLLQKLEPQLRPGTVILADALPEGGPVPKDILRDYHHYVRDPFNGYTSLSLNLCDGVEMSVRN